MPIEPSDRAREAAADPLGPAARPGNHLGYANDNRVPAAFSDDVDPRAREPVGRGG